jgi:teichuronic acid biosynthesis glycosyltransferase TuaG
LSQPISIICPYRNAARFLPGLITNVRQQTHRDWELLLIDDGSVDTGSDLARTAACGDQRIRFLTAPPRPSGSPQGPWWPRNVGLGSASHELIAFLDADDRWHPAKLQRQLRYHNAGDVRISVTGYARFDPVDNTLLGWRLPPSRFGYGRLRLGNAIPMLTLMLERCLLEEGFLPCPHEDYLRWLTLFRAQPSLRCVTIPELLAFYAVHDSNLTSRRWLMPLWTYGVFRAHGMGRLTSAASLVPWGLSQAESQWRCFRQPVRQPLQAALGAEPPWPLPPARSPK